MAQTKSEIQSLLDAGNTGPRHRFGQNFMIDQNLVRIVAAAGQIVAGDVVLEIGPGTGTLTEELLASPAARVIAVEIDRDLAGLLRRRFAANDRFQLIEGDALSGKHELNAELLKVITEVLECGSAGVSELRNDASAFHFDIPKRPHAHTPAIKLVANLPYNIASPLVIELLLAGVQLLAFTVQKEVADRLRAGAGDDAYGPLSVMVQSLAKVELLRTLPPQAFWPAPKIDSALVRVTCDDQLGSHAASFSRFVHQLFSTRRKTLRKSLTMAGYPAETMLADMTIDGRKRPEEFSPVQWREMFAKLHNQR